MLDIRHQIKQWTKGKSLHHFGFQLDDLKAAMAQAERLDLRVTQSWQRADGLGFAHLDSDKVEGVIFEMIQWPGEKNGLDSLKKR